MGQKSEIHHPVRKKKARLPVHTHGNIIYDEIYWVQIPSVSWKCQYQNVPFGYSSCSWFDCPKAFLKVTEMHMSEHPQVQLREEESRLVPAYKLNYPELIRYANYKTFDLMDYLKHILHLKSPGTEKTAVKTKWLVVR